ncbi:chaperone of endosialidase [Salmonella phage Kenya-K38]|nr:chaperone of endosialidase [Salmonella phage Kenya-K38]
MNYGVGDFHLRDSRSYIQPYEVVSDGQLLSRADWPELWAYAQMLTPIADADWLADPSQRGKYSLGDGSTTFRVPDRNGVQEGSIKGLFGRGDGGISAQAGSILRSAAPDVSGNVQGRTSVTTGALFNGGGGAFITSNQATMLDQTVAGATQGTIRDRYTDLTMRLSAVSGAYGRNGETADVYPSNFTGVWVIRASGGFVAANTSWTVYNSDQTLPPANTTANGGVVRSEYQVGGSLRAAASFVAQHTTRTDGSPTASLQLGVSDGSNSATWWYKANGHITSSTGRFFFDGVLNPGGNVEVGAGEFCSFILEDKDSADADGVGKWWSWALDGRYGSYFIKRLRGGINTGQIVINMPSSAGTIALQGTSGINFKHDIKDADLTEAMDRIEAMRMVNFIYNDDEENRVRFGIIAEEAELIAPQYIKHNQEPYEDILDEEGNKIGEKTRDRPSVDVNPIVMDLMGCVQALHAKIKALEARIAELESKE